MALGLTLPVKEMNTRNISWGARRPVHSVYNLTTFMCRMSSNLRASTSWNPQGLSRPVMGRLYLYYCVTIAYSIQYSNMVYRFAA